jgi:anaerobic carbon-monoxide dehydrogenase iron sulfur subunit
MSIAVDVDLCVGCRLCELACSFARHGRFNPYESAVRVNFEDDGTLGIAVGSECAACRRQLCAALCPTGAIEVLVGRDQG